MSDWVHLEYFVFSCRLGLYPSEQDREQPIEASVHLGLDLERAAMGDLAESVDYARVLAQVEFIGRHGKWKLLESFALGLARWFLLEPASGERRAQVNVVRVQLRKPEACDGRALPGVELTRDRQRLDVVASELAPGVRSENLYENKDIRLQRLQIAPASSWRPHLHGGTQLAWMSIAGVAKVGGVDVGGNAIRIGAASEAFPLVVTEAEPWAALVLSNTPLG